MGDWDENDQINGNDSGIAPSFGRGYAKKSNIAPSTLGLGRGGGYGDENSYKISKTDECNSAPNKTEASGNEWKGKSTGGNGWNQDGGDGNGWNQDGGVGNSGKKEGEDINEWNEGSGTGNVWGPDSNAGNSWQGGSSAAKSDDVPFGGGYREKRSGGNACYKCNEEGHMARNCPNVADTGRGGGRGGGGGRACFKCNEEGHMSRECPNPGSNRSSNNRACYKCNEEGHMSRDCPNPGSNRSSNNRACYKCNEEGHISKDCPKAGSSRSNACYNCHEEGHNSRDCPNPRKLNCKICYEEGHTAARCPQSRNNENDGSEFSESTARGGSSRTTCNRCKKEGHMARECTEKVTDDTGRELPMPYEPEDFTNDEQKLFESRGPTSGINFDKYDKIKIEVTNAKKPENFQSFDDEIIRELLRNNIKKVGYKKPTPIQKTCIPLLLDGHDIMACAQTGSGKTAAFMIPIVNYIMGASLEAGTYAESVQPVALVISPTRELARQIYEEAKKFSWNTIVKCALIYGGVTSRYQLNQLHNQGCHILVATVGRLNDFVGRGRITFDRLKYLVLDEADRMLDMGFEPAIKELINGSTMPKCDERQTLMFSATFPDQIQHLAKSFLKQGYAYVVIGSVGAANEDVKQTFEQIERREKKGRLVELLKEYVGQNKKVLVFVDTKRQTDFLATYLSQNGIMTTSIHGDRMQFQREEALNDFKTGNMKVLIATAVAARGLDIQGVDYVVNYDLPKEIDEYVHRIGRTGRVGNTGNSISFFEPNTDERLTQPLLKILSDANQDVPDWLIASGSGMSSNFESYDNDGFGARDVRSVQPSHGYNATNDDDGGWD